MVPRDQRIPSLPTRKLSRDICCACFVLLLWSIVGTNSTAASETTAEAPEQLDERIEFRKIYVPKDRLESWPTGGKKYLPLPQDTFDKLVQAAKERGRINQRVRVNKADHQARLETLPDSQVKPHLLEGVTSLEVRLDGNEPALLDLPCSAIAILDARWEGNPDQPVVIGYWHVPGEDQSSGNTRFGLPVDRSDTLILKWRLASEMSENLDSEFAFHLSDAPLQSLNLTLPSEYQLTSNSVFGLTEASSNSGANQWSGKLRPGSTHHLQIKLRGQQSLPINGNLRVSQHDDYQLRPVGVDYQASFQVAGAGKGDALSLLSSDLLKIQQVTVNGQPASWRRDSVQRQRVSIELADNAKTQEVLVRATSELIERRLWRLPKLVAPFENWKEGTCELRLDESLELQSLSPTDATLIQVGSNQQTKLPTGTNKPDSYEAYRLRYFTEKAAVAAIIRARKRQLLIEQETLLDLGDESIVSQVRLTLSALRTNAFQLRGNLLPEWEIESVQSETPSDLAHWHFEDSLKPPRLHLQFQRSPSRVNPIVLTLVARRPFRFESLPLEFSQLNWLTFPQDQLSRSVLAVQPSVSTQTQVRFESAGAGAETSDLQEIDFDWLGPNPNRQVVNLLTADSELLLGRKELAGSLEGTASLQVKPERARVGYQVDFRMIPQQGPVSELTIVSSQRLPERTTWRLLPEDSPLLVEEIKPNEKNQNAKAEQPARPVSYRVRFAKPQGHEFAVRLAYARPAIASQHRIDRFRMPAASQWHSWALVLGTHQEQSQSAYSYHVESGGCTPVTPPAVATADEFVLGCFRFAQEDPLLTENAPTIYASTTVSNSATTTNKSNAWHDILCTEAFVETDYSATGVMRGVVNYQLRSQLNPVAPHEVEFSFPSAVRLTAAEIDGQSVSLEESHNPRNRSNDYRLALPMSSESSIKLRYESANKPLSTGTALRANLPSTSFPILHGWWTLKTPPSFEIANLISPEETNPNRSRVSIFKRLLGPLVRLAKAPGTSSPSFARGSENTSLGYVETTHEFGSIPAPIIIQRPAERLGLWLSSWFGAALGSCWLITRRPRLVLTVIVACAAACLLFPLATIVVPQAVFLGCLAGGMIQAAFQGTLFESSVPKEARKSPWPAKAVVMAMLSSLAVGPELVVAREVPPAVLIPFAGPELTPTGEIYVPQQLLQDFQKVAELSETSGADWALLGTKYAITLDQTAADAPVQARESRLTFRIRTLVNQVLVELPLRRQEATWNLTKSTLNGIPLKAIWSEGDKLQLQIEEPGLHEVQLILIPSISRGAQAATLELSIPRFPGAILEITKPPSLEKLHAAAVTDFTARNSDRLVSAVLGGTEKLVLSWKPASLVNPAKLRVEQFEWLAIDSDRITGEARLRLLGEQLPEILTLVHTPAMQIDSVVDQAGSSMEIIPQASGGESLLQLQSGVTLPVDLKVAFHLNRPSLGRVSFPYLHIRELQRIRRLFAVSVAGELTFQEDQREKLRQISPAEFTALWENDIPMPDLAYAMQSKYPSWSVSVRPRGEMVILDGRIGLSCRAKHVDLAFTATMVDSRSSAHQKLTLPRELEVDQIEIIVGENERVPLHWSRPAGNSIELFLSEPLSEPGTIRILGRLKNSEAGELNFPTIEFEGAEQATPLVEIRHDLNVETQLLTADGKTIQPTTVPKRRLTTGLELSLGEYALSAEVLRETKLRVSPYKAKFRADTAAVLRDEKTADYAVDLHAVSGRVQRLSILADQAWAPKSDANVEFEISPKGQTDEGLGRYELVLKEPLEAGQRKTLIVHGGLTNQAAYRLRVPRIQLAAGRTDRRYLVIPTAINEKSIAWQLSGVRRRSLVRRLSEALVTSEASRSFRVTRDNYVAEQRIFPDQLRRARIRHAETAGIFDEAGIWVGTTHFLLQPGRATSCAVTAPAGIEILDITVAGQRVLIDADSPHLATVTLGPPYLPVEIAVAYRQANHRDSSTASLQTPQLAMAEQTLPIRSMHWQVRKPVAAWSVLSDAKQLDQAVYHRQGLTARVDAVSEAAPMALQLHSQESQNWLRPWRERIDTSISSPLIPFRDAAAGPDEDLLSPKTPKEVFQLFQMWEELKRLFSATEDAQLGNSEDAKAPSLLKLNQGELAQPTLNAIYLETEGSDLLHLERQSSWPTLAQWLAVGAILAGYFFSKDQMDRVLSRVESVESHIWQRRAQLVLLLFGICWWLFLRPRLLGAALAFIAAAALIRQAVTRLAHSRRVSQLSMESTAHQPASP